MRGTELVTNAATADPLRIVLVAPPYFDIPPRGYGGTEAVVAERPTRGSAGTMSPCSGPVNRARRHG